MPLQNTPDRKRYLNDLAVSYGRAMQKKETGYVHTQNGAAISFYENLCFALALLKTRSVDNVLEAKELIAKLFAFDTFPVRLHEFPYCYDPAHPVRLLAALVLIDREFSAHVDVKKEMAALWEKAKSSPESLVKRALAHIFDGAEKPEPNGEEPTIAAELLEEEWGYDGWNSHLGFFPSHPKIRLADYAMALKENRYPERLLAPNPLHLQLALLSPSAQEMHKTSHEMVCCIDKGFTLYFGDQSALWTFSDKSRCQFDNFIYIYPQETPGEGKEVEVAFTWNFARDSAPYINGERATVGYLDDRFTIRAAGMEIALSFELEKGEGDFTVHVSKESDEWWMLAVRTLRRSSELSLKCLIDIRQLEGEPRLCQFIRSADNAFEEKLVGSLAK